MTATVTRLGAVERVHAEEVGVLLALFERLQLVLLRHSEKNPNAEVYQHGEVVGGMSVPCAKQGTCGRQVSAVC